MQKERIGVIGAGVMGIGVAQNFAEKGYEVILVDTSQEILEKAERDMNNSIRFSAFLKKEKTSENIRKRITFTTHYECLKDVLFMIENVNEKLETKKAAYQKMDRICKADCFFLANTSCISITKIAAMTSRPDKVIGVHFMNPVPLKSTVEVIKGCHTSENTVKIIKRLLKEIGKESIVVNDYPGFVSNRISHLFMNEAAFVVQDQVANPQEVDAIFKQCYEHKMGPLETADLIGLDTVVNSLDILYTSYQDSKFRCCPLLRKMVDAGLLGRKSGKGFYEY